MDLALVFLVLMGTAILAYVILDGFDLGVGILLPAADRTQQDIMVSSIGPFWDANETWLVLGVGILLVAFPLAHGVILTALYLPVAFMLLGLILRGVAFEFRFKATGWHREIWNHAFFVGSLVMALSQGVMLAGVITGFAKGWGHLLFGLAMGLGLAGGYALLGAAWLVIKTEGELHDKALT
ncbi:MAG: cytochrome d ubiquinol oxidase subunit II, partial [Burkholderiales bacterium]|nr:cytochrome d ubiquinol oxidase subunit II [Burkholderiales bacterium]